MSKRVRWVVREKLTADAVYEHGVVVARTFEEAMAEACRVFEVTRARIKVTRAH